MVDALKPCPFCGSDAYAKVGPYQFPPDHEGGAWTWGYSVVCDASGFEGSEKGCGSSSAWAETRAEAVEAWNNRSTLSNAVAEREAEPVAWLYDWPNEYGSMETSASVQKIASVNRRPASNHRPLYLVPPTSELEALRKRVAELERERDASVAARNDFAKDWDAAHKRADAAEARVAELGKALEPFALVAEHDIGESEADDDLFRPMERHNRAPRLMVGHLRAARRVLEGGKVE